MGLQGELKNIVELNQEIVECIDSMKTTGYVKNYHIDAFASFMRKPDRAYVEQLKTIKATLEILKIMDDQELIKSLKAQISQMEEWRKGMDYKVYLHNDTFEIKDAKCLDIQGDNLYIFGQQDKQILFFAPLSSVQCVVAVYKEQSEPNSKTVVNEFKIKPQELEVKTIMGLLDASEKKNASNV